MKKTLIFMLPIITIIVGLILFQKFNVSPKYPVLDKRNIPNLNLYVINQDSLKIEQKLVTNFDSTLHFEQIEKSNYFKVSINSYTPGGFYYLNQEYKFIKAKDDDTFVKQYLAKSEKNIEIIVKQNDEKTTDNYFDVEIKKSGKSICKFKSPIYVEDDVDKGQYFFFNKGRSLILKEKYFLYPSPEDRKFLVIKDVYNPVPELLMKNQKEVATFYAGSNIVGNYESSSIFIADSYKIKDKNTFKTIIFKSTIEDNVAKELYSVEGIYSVRNDFPQDKTRERERMSSTSNKENGFVEYISELKVLLINSGEKLFILEENGTLKSEIKPQKGLNYLLGSYKFNNKMYAIYGNNLIDIKEGKIVDIIRNPNLWLIRNNFFYFTESYVNPEGYTFKDNILVKYDLLNHKQIGNLTIDNKDSEIFQFSGIKDFYILPNKKIIVFEGSKDIYY